MLVLDCHIYVIPPLLPKLSTEKQESKFNLIRITSICREVTFVLDKKVNLASIVGELVLVH